MTPCWPIKYRTKLLTNGIDRSVLISLGLLAVVASLVQYKMTEPGISLWEDTFDYFSASIQIVEGGRYGRIDGFGAFKPLTHFPPGYPALLAGVQWLGIDIYDAARAISVFFFGLNSFLTGVAVFQITRSRWWALVGSIIMLTSEPTIEAHLWALSEPVFIACSITTLIYLGRFLNTPHESQDLLFATFFAALGLFTRYAGLSIILAGSMLLLIDRNTNFLERSRTAVIFGIGASLPTTLFLLRNYVISGNLTDDPGISWHPPTIEEWQETANLFLNWFLPDFVIERLMNNWSLIILGFILCLTVGLAIYLITSKQDSSQRLIGIRTIHFKAHWIYLVMYLFVFAGTLYFLRRITPSDQRLLSPMYPSSIVLLLGYLISTWSQPNKALKVGSLLIATTFMVFQVIRFRGLFQTIPLDARGIASQRWVTSETIAYVNTMPETLIFSNEIQAIYFHANRNAIYLPTPYNPATERPRNDYLENLAEMRRVINQDHGYIVIFYPERLEVDYYQELTDGLQLEEALLDGEVFGRITDD